MRRIKRLLLLIFSVCILLLGAVVAIPYLYKSEIIELLKADINQNLNSEVEFDDNVSVSILHTFPNLEIKVRNVVVLGTIPNPSDTFIYCKEIESRIGLKSLYINHEIDLQYLELHRPTVSLVSTEQADNWDIFKESNSESSSLNLSAEFDNILVNDGKFQYVDSASSTVLDLSAINGQFTGNYGDDVIDLLSDFNCADAYIEYDRIPYVNHIPIKTEANTSIDLLTDNYTFKENSFWAGTIKLSAAGGIQYLDDSLEIDIRYKSENASLKDLIALTPAYYTKDIDKITMTGVAALNGTVKGIISDAQLPGYTFNIELSDGLLFHPEMNSPLKNIDLALAINNNDGRDESLTLDLQSLSFSLNDNPFRAKCYAKNIYGDPFINGKAAGNINLSEIDHLIPSEYHTTVSGLVNCDLSMQGALSQIGSSNVQRINTLGNVTLHNVSYMNPEKVPKPININKGQFSFTENNIDLDVLDVKAGKSDLMMTGKLNNWLGYVLSNQTLDGQLTLFSSMLDAGDFMTVESSSETENPIALPNNVSVALTYDIEELQYTNHTFQHIVGEASLNDKSLNIKELSTKLFDGQVVLAGFFNTTDPLSPLANLDLVVQNINIKKTFESFETLRKIAPIFERIDGRFSSTLKLRTELLNDFSPNLSNITCQGVLDLFNCDVVGLKSLSSIGTKLNLDAFKKPINIKDLLLSFSIMDGKIEVNPFAVPIGESTLSLVGYSKLDNSISYDGLISVPKKLYASNNTNLNSYIPQSALSKLDSLEWSDLEFDVDIAGTYTNPKIAIDYKSTKQSVATSLKNQVKSKLDSRKEELEKQAKDEMDAAKKRADEAKRIAEEKAKAALEEQKKRIEEELKKEKEEAKRKLEEELRKKKEELLKDKFPIPPK